MDTMRRETVYLTSFGYKSKCLKCLNLKVLNVSSARVYSLPISMVEYSFVFSENLVTTLAVKVNWKDRFTK